MGHQDFSGWIGRKTETCEDVLTHRMVAEFQATMAPYLAKPPRTPAGMHWCLCPALVEQENLGPDGHPTKGATLPPVELPRRMWAGGTIHHLATLPIATPITRTSTINDISWKNGKSGPLCFVTVAHDYQANGTLCIRETHNIVYRGDGPVTVPQKAANAGADFDQSWRIPITTTTLFRYSAMTFNGHRIHYDVAHARDTEGYNDLVIHGPLQATYLYNLATEHFGAIPTAFDYRAMAPATGAQTMQFGLRETEGGCALTALTQDGGVTMTATATLT